MIAVLTVLIIVLTALFGAVGMSGRINEQKHVHPFECGFLPSNAQSQFHINLKPAVLFLILDATVVVILLIVVYKKYFCN